MDIYIFIIILFVYLLLCIDSIWIYIIYLYILYDMYLLYFQILMSLKARLSFNLSASPLTFPCFPLDLIIFVPHQDDGAVDVVVDAKRLMVP